MFALITQDWACTEPWSATCIMSFMATDQEHESWLATGLPHTAENQKRPSSPPQSTQQTRKRGVRRNREFRRYAEAVIDLQINIEGEAATSSRDLALTAFAQLVTLRLNAKRAMISLFDSGKQYVIAEATRTLSLQKDAVHAPCDGLWFGASVWDRTPDDFFKYVPFLFAHQACANIISFA